MLDPDGPIDGGFSAGRWSFIMKKMEPSEKPGSFPPPPSVDRHFLESERSADPMRFFLAGIMQGSHAEALIHDQEYRTRIRRLLEIHFPGADVYDPRTDHAESLGYDHATGRQVFFHHNRMCREVDVLLAFVPEASMGTAIEMWEAYQHGAAVIAVSPLKHNWAVKFLSHVLYADLEAFEAALERGEIAERIREVREHRPHPNPLPKGEGTF